MHLSGSCITRQNDKDWKCAAVLPVGKIKDTADGSQQNQVIVLEWFSTCDYLCQFPCQWKSGGHAECVEKELFLQTRKKMNSLWIEFSLTHCCFRVSFEVTHVSMHVKNIAPSL